MLPWFIHAVVHWQDSLPFHGCMVLTHAHITVYLQIIHQWTHRQFLHHGHFEECCNHCGSGGFSQKSWLQYFWINMLEVWYLVHTLAVSLSGLYFWFVCVHVCMHALYVCLSYVYMSVIPMCIQEVRGGYWVFWFISFSNNFFETGYFTAPGAGLVASKSHRPL